MMTSSRVLAFGAIFLVGSALLWGQAAVAFGQQWRPAPMAPTMGAKPTPWQLANRPNFRPHGTPMIGVVGWSGPNTTSRAQPRGFRPRAPLIEIRPRPHRRAAARVPAMPHYYAPRPRYIAAPMSASAWMPPPMPFAPGWQRPVGGSVPHFAWQPMVTAPPALRYPPPVTSRAAYRVAPWQPTPTAGMFRPRDGFSQTAPAPMRWRPVAAAGLVHQQPARLAPPTQQGWRYDHRRPVWRSQTIAQPLRVSAASPRHIGPAGWRAQPMRPMQPPVDFRPPAYGRSNPDNPRFAAARDRSLAAARAGALPGWATTYDDTRDDLACGWCNGS